MTDDEYFWEPVPECWSVRPRATETGGSVGRGEFVIDWVWPPPEPAPLTTIAWRLNHLLTALAVRSAAHFGRTPVDFESYPYAGTAEVGLRKLDEEYATWREGVIALGEDGLARPCGPAEGPFAEYPMAALVLHIHREVLHHGAEIALLRDLFAHQPQREH